jgi:hypothetical protein
MHACRLVATVAATSQVPNLAKIPSQSPGCQLQAFAVNLMPAFAMNLKQIVLTSQAQ